VWARDKNGQDTSCPYRNGRGYRIKGKIYLAPTDTGRRFRRDELSSSGSVDVKAQYDYVVL
jgi:hypothetical protein